MTGSGPKLGVLLLLAVLLQTVVVTITVLHFTTALNSVRKVWTRELETRGGTLRISAQCVTQHLTHLSKQLNSFLTLKAYF